ncbi:hypothetical protein Tco_0226772 [Tanacetum coccineum]
MRIRHFTRRRNHGISKGLTRCMTRRSNSKLVTLFADPERQFHTRRDLTPSSVHNIFSFYEYEASETESEEMGEVDIDTLTIE